MYRVVKYTDDTRNSRNEKLEWKIRRFTCTIHVGYNMSRIHWILRQLTSRSFPKLKLNLHGKRFSDFDEIRTESDFKKRHGLVMGSTTQEMLTNPGRLFEKLCRSPKTFEIALFSFDVAQSAPYIYIGT